MFDLQNNWVVPLHKVVDQTRKPMHEEGKFEDQRDPKQRKGRGGMTDQIIQTRPAIDHNRKRSVKNKGPLSSNSLSCQCDGLVYNKNRYHIGQPGVSQIKHASHCENYHFRDERGRDCVKLKERSSDFEKWCKRRAYTSAYRSDRLVGRNRPHSDRHRANIEKSCTRNHPTHDSIWSNDCSSDIEKRQKIPARGSSSQGDQPVQNLNTHHSGGHRVNRLIRMWENCIAGKDHCQEMHSVDRFTRAPICETCCSRNECRWDSVQKNIEKWHKRRARNSSHGSVWPVINNWPHGDGYWFNQFNHISYCEKCHSRNNCCQGSVEHYESSSDFELWSNSGAQFTNKKHWVNPFKNTSYGKNWHLRNGQNKDGFKDLNHSSDCENRQKKNPHNPFRHTIWAIFNRKLNRRSHSNRQAVAQFKSDCENWRSGKDRNRDQVDHQKGSPDDKNWRSSKRDQVERCDGSSDHHKATEHPVADSIGEKKETEVQHMCNAGRYLILKPDSLSMA